MEFVTRVLVQMPDPRRHLVRYGGAYSNATPRQAQYAAIPHGPHRAALRRRWAESIRHVYEVDPLGSGTSRSV
jgi:hypothetical protein